MKVIGSAGSDDKVAFLKELGCFDVVFNYKTESTRAILGANPPDIYFDNVGGATLEAVLDTINKFGRIIACGELLWDCDRFIAFADGTMQALSPTTTSNQRTDTLSATFSKSSVKSSRSKDSSSQVSLLFLLVIDCSDLCDVGKDSKAFYETVPKAIANGEIK